MKCPLCDKEMEAGGLIIDGVAPMWMPMSEYERKGLKRLIYQHGRSIGKASVLLSQTKVDNAFFCRDCNKIVGIFDVTNNIDD